MHSKFKASKCSCTTRWSWKQESSQAQEMGLILGQVLDGNMLQLLIRTTIRLQGGLFRFPSSVQRFYLKTHRETQIPIPTQAPPHRALSFSSREIVETKTIPPMAKSVDLNHSWEASRYCPDPTVCRTKYLIIQIMRLDKAAELQGQGSYPGSAP